MTNLSGLPKGDFNFPPGVSIRDIDRQCQETEQPPNCPECNGEGEVAQMDASGSGEWDMVRCPTCHGIGFQT